MKVTGNLSLNAKLSDAKTTIHQHARWLHSCHDAAAK